MTTLSSRVTKMIKAYPMGQSYTNNHYSTIRVLHCPLNEVDGGPAAIDKVGLEEALHGEWRLCQHSGEQ